MMTTNFISSPPVLYDVLRKSVKSWKNLPPTVMDLVASSLRGIKKVKIQQPHHYLVVERNISV